MMLKTFNSIIKQKEKIVRLALKDSRDGSVLLHVVDEFGADIPGGNLLNISEDGVMFHTYVNKDIGFILDPDDNGLVVRR